jgi:murein endopeptidase
VPRDVTGLPYPRGGDINTGTRSSRLGLDTRVITLLYKKLLLQNTKKLKLDTVWQNLLRKAVVKRGLFCQC